MIERQLDQVHTLVTDADDDARAEFNRLKGWDRRQRAITEVAARKLNAATSDRVKAVLRLIESPASKRNELAHCVWGVTKGYEGHLTLLPSDNQHAVAQAAVAANKAGTSGIPVQTQPVLQASRLVSAADLDRLIYELQRATDRLEGLIYGHLYADFLDVTGNGFSDYRGRLDADPEIQERVRSMMRNRKRAQRAAMSSPSSSLLADPSSTDIVPRGEEALTLYFAPGSSSMAAHIGLHEVGAQFEGRPISFRQKENRTAEYLALNPEGKVPILLVDNRPLTEVAAILFYLAKAFPDAKLLPDDLEAQAQAISWMSFAASTLHPARRKGLEHAISVYQIADQRLAGREWVLGTYSIADIHLFRLFWRLNASLKPSPETFPNLLAHHDRMMLRPAVRKTIEIESAIGYELPA